MARHRVHPLSYQTQQQLLGWLVNNGDLTEKEQRICLIHPVTDDKMNPQLRIGGLYVNRITPPIWYADLLGKVVDVWLDNRKYEMFDRHVVGRLKAIDNQTIYLTFDNPAFEGTQIKRSQAASISQVLFVINQPVV